jgi:hypothetical protein
MKYINQELFKEINKNQNNFIFREYTKDSNKFVATNNFFTSQKTDTEIFEFVSFDYNEKITPYNELENIYTMNVRTYSDDNSFLDRKYINLVVISNISFSLDEININNNDIIKKFIENDITIDESFFNDIYFNNDFSQKINIELPKKFGEKKFVLEDIEIDKKYFFKVNILELSLGFSEENLYI